MKKSKLKKATYKKIFLLVISGSLLVIFSLFLYINVLSSKKTPSLKILAEDIVTQCQKTDNKQKCYEQHVPQLMDAPYYLSMQDAFKVVEHVQTKDTSYKYCHLLGHEISEKEIKKNPANWKKVIANCPGNPTNGCDTGCIHGAFIAKFNTDRYDDGQLQKLSDELRDLCEKNTIWAPIAQQTIGCFHALGHAAMYLTNADVGKSLAFCRRIGDRDKNSFFTNNCYSGVFMQLFEPLEKEDELLVKRVKPNKENVLSYCFQYSHSSRAVCLSQAWPYFFDEFENPENLTAYCNKYDPKFTLMCYNTIVNIMTSHTNLDEKFIFKYCSQLPSAPPGRCFGFSAARMVEIQLTNLPKALTLCEKAIPLDPQGLCYQELIKRSYRFFNDEDSRISSICSHFPVVWQKKCAEES